MSAKFLNGPAIRAFNAEAVAAESDNPWGPYDEDKWTWTPVARASTRRYEDGSPTVVAAPPRTESATCRAHPAIVEPLRRECARQAHVVKRDRRAVKL